MRRATLVHIRKIEGLTDEHFQSLREDFEQFGFDEVKGYGFVNVEEIGQRLSAILVLRKVGYRTEFNPATREFSRQEILDFDRITFAIDRQFESLDIFASAAKSRQVVAVLADLFDYRLTIEASGITPAHGLRCMATAEKPFVLKKLALSNFTPEPGIVGRFTPTVTDNQSALALIQDQEDALSSVTIATTVADEDNVVLTIAQNGGATLTCTQDHFIEIFKAWKQLLFSSPA